MSRSLATLIVLLTAASPMHTAHAQAVNHIRSVAPTCASPGERVSISGFGFGAFNVRVTVAGIPADVEQANGQRVTFIVPPQAALGDTIVGVTHVAGNQTGSIAFRVGCGYVPPTGVVLPGVPSALAINAIVEMPPVGVDGSAISNDVIMNRLSVRLTPHATVGQVNAALAHVGGGIVTMSPGTLSLTISIPRQSTLDDIEQLAATLSVQPGIRFAWPAVVASPKQLPFFNPIQSDLELERFLLPGRFPAAWNAVSLAVERHQDGTFTCRRAPIPVLIADLFGAPPLNFSNFVPAFQPPDPAPAGTLTAATAAHGYLVAITGTSRRGANPFVECLDIRLVQNAGLTSEQQILRIAGNLPASGKSIVNVSLGFVDECAASPCTPPSDRMPEAVVRAYAGLTWKEKTRQRWPDFLTVVAAGNEHDKEGTTIYPGLGDARFGSAQAIAAGADPLMGFVTDGALWDPLTQPFVTLGATLIQAASLADDIRTGGLDGVAAVADNVVAVGSSNNMLPANVSVLHITPEQLVESSFSDRHSDVLAVGEDILNDATLRGTSLSAPQISGLASYLWLLSPALRNEPPAVTRRTIVSNTRNGSIDAYAAVLSLDAAITDASSAPVRNALLDLDGDGGFTEADIDESLQHLFVVDPSGAITRQASAGTIADFSRHDLNGDGFTTAGSRREHFDLDRIGSVQFGATNYSTVSQSVDGQHVRFDETALTDLEILCFYAYSPLYGGNPDVRDEMLSGRCSLAISPGSASLTMGGTVQFAANSPTSAAVNWTATCGNITNTGLYTSTVAGTCTVRASNAADASVFAEATVTVSAPPTGARLQGSLRLVAHWDERISNYQEIVDVTLSVDVTVSMSVQNGRQVIPQVFVPASGTLTGTSTQIRECGTERDSFAGGTVVGATAFLFGPFSTGDFRLRISARGTNNGSIPAECGGGSFSQAVTLENLYNVPLQLNGTVTRSADGTMILGVDFNRTVFVDLVEGAEGGMTITTSGELRPVP